MYVGLKQPRGDEERYVTPARAAAKETTLLADCAISRSCCEIFDDVMVLIWNFF